MPIHVTTTTTQTLSNKSFSGPSRFDGNVTIFGDLSCSGTQTFQNTVFSTTSAVSVVHIGSGPALWVGNNGTGDIASFYDIDQNVEILHVGGNNGTFPNVGVKTSTPNADFTVKGSISASSVIYDALGNSSNWNSAYTTINAQSAANASVYSSFNSQSAANASLYTTTNSKSANWDSVYSSFNAQSASNASVYSSFNTQSAANASVYSSVNAQSANWNSVYTTVQSNSATTWNYQGTDIKALTGSWQNTYTNFSTQSANNIAVYSTVNSNSAAWGTGGSSGFAQPVGASVAYTATGTTSAFSISSLSIAATNANNFITTINGIMQQPAVDYDVSGSTLTFTSAPDNGDKIVVITNSVVYGTQTLTATNITTSTLSAQSLTATDIVATSSLRVQGNITSSSNLVVVAALTANQTIGAAADVTLNLDPKIDPNNWFNRSTRRALPTVAGYYFTTLQVSWAAGTEGPSNQNNIQIRKTGSTVAIAQMTTKNFTSTTMNTCALVYMNGTTDYLDYTVYSSPGQNVTGPSDGNWTKIELFKIN